jgi:uncharacterized membrane protein YqhA
MNRVLGLTRYVVLLGVAGSLLAGTILFLGSLLAVIANGVEAARYLTDPAGLKRLAIEVIQLADYFLIGTALYIVGVGLYELFIGQVRLPPPLAWLRIETLDELKDRLISVVVTVLAVTFLAEAANWKGDEILEYGLSVAVVILALGAFGWLTRSSKVKSQAP